MTDQSPPTRLARSSNELLEATSFLSGTNAAFVEALYAQYLENPDAVDESWRAYFSGLGQTALDPAQLGRGPEWRRDKKPRLENGDLVGALTGQWPARKGVASEADLHKAAQDSIRAIQLVRAYRVIGHLEADLDPLNITPKQPHPQLDPNFYGFHTEDLDRPIFLDGVMGLSTSTPRQVTDILKRTYCGRIGYEFMHINDAEQKDWLQRRIEGPDKEIVFSPEGKKAILNKLVEAEGFEKFASLRFLGTKRFGLDGGEAMIPALEQIIKRGGQLGVKEIVIGMAHRGRLNVLANVMSKPYRQLFHEFSGGSANPQEVQGSGDVKYHLGASSDRQFDNHNVHLSLTANPSHLEASDPVVLGKARAKQQQREDTAERTSVLPLLLHGDAAFAGQGVVAECFSMSGTRGFRTGGTIHFIINNQIGFTTSPAYSRSSPYCTDIALMVQAPIFHVNGDDPEAVVHCARIAHRIPPAVPQGRGDRHGVLPPLRSQRDAGADLQPALMYKAIKDHPTTLQIYARKLVDEGTLTQAESDAMSKAFVARLDEELAASKSHKPEQADWLDGRWSGLGVAPKGDRRGDTAVPLDVVREVGAALTRLPQGFNLHKTVARSLEAKDAMFASGEGFDWSTAEALAFGTLMLEGMPIRFSGQDSTEGTFSQRHAALVDQQTEKRYYPLANIRDGQANFEIIDSLLSEEAVLGFEYGYSSAEPKALTLWEAQFGDFANGAQVIIDQFIASGETKWLRMCGLVMLLPHGYEGQGPEHSSARLERYLQLCAQDKHPGRLLHDTGELFPRPAPPDAPAVPQAADPDDAEIAFAPQEVHLVPGRFRSRLVLPPRAARPGGVGAGRLDDQAGRGPRDQAGDPVQRQGLFRPDGSARQAERKRRVHPAAGAALSLSGRPAGTGAEPLPQGRHRLVPGGSRKNQGAWTFVRPRIEQTIAQLGGTGSPRYVGRPEYASTAAGLMSQHNAELKTFLAEALTL